MVSVSTSVPAPIGMAERQARLAGLRRGMETAGVDTVLLGSTTSLRYFTGLDWYASERLVGALVHAAGGLDYVTPQFELEKVEGLISLPGEVLTWEEDESPWRLVADRIGPPPLPPSGPKSINQSAVLMTSRLCSMTSTVLP